MDPVKSVQEGRNGTGIPARVGEAAYLRFQSRSTIGPGQACPGGP